MAARSDEEGAVREVVLEQMQALGWRSVPLADVSISNVSGGGGGQTFKVTAPARPPAVAFHKRNRSSAADHIAEERTAAAARLFSEMGLAPARICESEDWFIEVWEGKPVSHNPMMSPDPAGLPSEHETLPKCSTAGCDLMCHAHKWHVKLSGDYYCCLSCAGKGFNKGGHDPADFMIPCQQQLYSPDNPIAWAEDTCTTVEEIGALLAQVHKAPTSWFDRTKRQLFDKFPILRTISQTSALWWWTRSLRVFGSFSEEGLRQWAEEDLSMYVPRTAAASRIVTVHGDFHGANMLRVGESLRVIDFENSTVMLAAMDLAWACAVWCKAEEEQRRFLAAYLEASGYGGAEESSVEAVLLDVKIFSLLMPGGPASMAFAGAAPQQPGSAAIRELCAEAARRYRESADFRAEVDGKSGPGLVPWSPSKGLAAYITTHAAFTAEKADEVPEQKGQGMKNQGD